MAPLPPYLLADGGQKAPQDSSFHLVQTNAIEHSAQPGHQLPWIVRVVKIQIDQGLFQMAE